MRPAQVAQHSVRRYPHRCREFQPTAQSPRYAGPAPIPGEQDGNRMNAPNHVPQAVIDALRRGDKMTAIKLVRELTGDDLKAAMQMVQQVATQLQAQGKDHSGPHSVPETKGQRESREHTQDIMAGRRVPTVMPGDQGGRGMIWLLLIVLIAGWFFFGR